MVKWKSCKHLLYLCSAFAWPLLGLCSAFAQPLLAIARSLLGFCLVTPQLWRWCNITSYKKMMQYHTKLEKRNYTLFFVSFSIFDKRLMKEQTKVIRRSLLLPFCFLLHFWQKFDDEGTNQGLWPRWINHAWSKNSFNHCSWWGRRDGKLTF